MLRAAGAKPRRATVVLALVAVVGGCGADDFANDPRAAPESSVGAVVTVKGVAVSPARLDAGSIELIASNQTQTSQRVQLRSERLASGGAPLAQRTGPINPGGTASLQADLVAGTYVVSASSAQLAPATIVVAPARGDGSDRLLQP
jgi:hypothetical protein